MGWLVGRRPADERDPGGVGVEVGERQAQQAGGFEGADVVLDDGVGAHVRVAVHGAGALVGPVAPVAPVVASEQRALRAAVAGNAPPRRLCVRCEPPPASRRCPTPPARRRRPGRGAPTPLRAPPPGPPTGPPPSPGPTRAPCDTASAPTPRRRTGPPRRADTRYRPTPPRRRRASTSPGSTPCPDHGPAPAHPPTAHHTTKTPPDPTDQQTPPTRAPPPPHNP